MSDESAAQKSKDFDGVHSVLATHEIYRPDVDTSGVDEKKLIRKIDLRLIPWLAGLYFLNSLDRGSIGNARLYGMETDLHLTDQQYLIALTVFFFPYSLLEPASNLALRQLRPSRWFAVIVFVWGLAMVFPMCHGFARNYGDLLGLRILLGVAEAGLYPGIVFYLSCWYRRDQLGTRVAAFFTSSTIAGAFSGLLAAAIHNMNGVAGYPGWAWIFILEGLVTIVVAVVSLWILQDFPQSATMLSEAERVFIIRGLQEDMQFSAGSGEKFKMDYLWQTIKDPKTYLAMGIYAGFDGPLFAFSLFTPTIVNQLGFGATAANLLSVPVYAWGCILTCIVGVLGDRLGRRGYINLALFTTGLTGYLILVCSHTPGLSYFATYLAASAWVSSNTEGSYKRGATLAFAIGFGNLNGAVSSNVYRSVDKPWYRLGHGIILAYVCIGWLSSLAYMFLLRRENAAKARGERDEVILGVDNKNADPKNGEFESINHARREKGDAWSGFYYTL
ncbi:MFS general substrate transporter [Vararia minispora EC-137]|uniref:MFS general substrate transporter n=1 Tax=Vararia minispora EC-137 TaxID=1314806 RepID=A0ACB8QQY8_9AGAM|nr:MFS general substrate transporter [Vararia minispora EC-137]